MHKECLVGYSEGYNSAQGNQQYEKDQLYFFCVVHRVGVQLKTISPPFPSAFLYDCGDIYAAGLVKDQLPLYLQTVETQK